MSKRTVFSVSEKQKICDYKESNQNASQQSIATHFSLLWKKPISRRCVGDILSDREKWFNINDPQTNFKRMKSAKHEKLEEALYTWILQMTAKNAPVTGDIIREYAKMFGQKMNITDFEYSNGWLNRFKKRRGLSQYIRCGETANIKEDIVIKGREELRTIISHYEEADVYNMDESGLFYRLQPDKAISNRPVKGCKKAKDRVSLVFCTNADGSDKRTLTVIGKSAKPRCFKNFNPALYVDYENNRKAWMTADLFKKWLLNFNAEIKRKKRHILLILDNAPCHKATSVSNIRIEFLPPDCTGVLQPLDAGIIKSFKAQYRKYHIRDIIERASKDEFSPLSLKDAIYMMKNAWHAVSSETIVNCWRHTGLINGEISTRAQSTVEIKELQDHISKLTNLHQPLTATEYINADTDIPTFEDMNLDQIIELAETDPKSESSETESENEDEVQQIKPDEARDCIQKLRRFLEKNATDKTMMDNLLVVGKDVENIIMQKKKQVSILKYFCPVKNTH